MLSIILREILIKTTRFHSHPPLEWLKWTWTPRALGWSQWWPSRCRPSFNTMSIWCKFPLQLMDDKCQIWHIRRHCSWEEPKHFSASQTSYEDSAGFNVVLVLHAIYSNCEAWAGEFGEMGEDRVESQERDGKSVLL